MTERINGRTALMLLVEDDSGYHGFDEDRVSFLRKEAEKFFIYLAKKTTEDQAKQIFRAIIKDTKNELAQEWQDAFILDRKREKSRKEINLLDEEDTTPRDIIEHSIESELTYKKKLVKIADSVTDSYKNWERWNKARQHTRDIEAKIELLQKISKHQNGLTWQEKKAARELVSELKYLRMGVKVRGKSYSEEDITNPGCYKVYPTTHIRSLHGDGVYIGITKWKELMNQLNELIGVEKRYRIREFESKESSEDMLDNAQYMESFDTWSC